jgi:hypothetical protein
LNFNIKHILLLLLLLLGGVRGFGQTTDPDTVCLGTTKPYWVTLSPGSTYNWWISNVLQPTTNDTIVVTWTTLGNDTLKVQEISADNCLGDIRSLPVYVKNDPPMFNVPELDSGYCVENISAAVYTGNKYNEGDLVPPRPDWYQLPLGSTMLDIYPADDCPGELTISWMIFFRYPESALPNLSGTGQISAATPIQFPVGDNFITWTVTDVAGQTTTKSVHLIVLPRPEIGDITY